MLCKDIMRNDVKWVLPDITVARAAKLMESYNLDLLPVCGADSKPLGVLTDRDIALRVVAKDRQATLTRVDEVMTRSPEFVSPETPADRVAEVMSQQGASRLLVIDDAGNLKGIVSLSNLLTIAPAELALSAARGICSWDTVHRTSANGQVSLVDTKDLELTTEAEANTGEIENPARAEAESVVQGGTNELKEFPG
jgi:CBS domain-containing protein